MTEDERDEAEQEARAKAFYAEHWLKKLEFEQALEPVYPVEELAAWIMGGQLVKGIFDAVTLARASRVAAAAPRIVGSFSGVFIASLMRIAQVGRGRVEATIMMDGYRVAISAYVRIRGDVAVVKNLVVAAAEKDRYSTLVLPLEVRLKVVQALRMRFPNLRQVAVDLVGFGREVFRL